jgi:hypothetical protein
VNAKLNRIAARWLMTLGLATAVPAWAAPQDMGPRQLPPGNPAADVALRTPTTPAAPAPAQRLAWDRVGSAMKSVA